VPPKKFTNNNNNRTETKRTNDPVFAMAVRIDKSAGHAVLSGLGPEEINT
jgi:hypothetical protein